MSQEILDTVEMLANEKDLSRETVFQAMEVSMGAAIESTRIDPICVEADIDRSTGSYCFFQVHTVIEDDAYDQLPLAEKYAMQSLAEAKKLDANVQVNDVIRQPLKEEQSRMFAFRMRQNLNKALRKAERQKLAEKMGSLVGSLLTCQVKRVTREAIFVEFPDYRDITGCLPRTECLNRDIFRINDVIKACVLKVNAEDQGPLIGLSRICDQMLVELFALEVPEIKEGIIEVKGCARLDDRYKLAVKSSDSRIDPVGACVGMRGSRVQAVSSELGSDRIEIILWDSEPSKYVMNALSPLLPAEIKFIEVDELDQRMTVYVTQEHCDKAIGYQGQNVRLASMLTGWHLKILPEDQCKTDQVSEAGLSDLSLDDEILEIFQQAGYTKLSDFKNITLEDLQKFDAFDDEIAQQIHDQIKEVFFMRALSQVAQEESPEALSNLPSMTDQIQQQFEASSIKSLRDLADCSVVDLVDETNIDDKLAGKLIMEARRELDH
ncbi:transcription termination factor NusA [Gammaproteobacteria bacterium]|jgi:transcription termination/antitermination protein NusA|nr:transcription termination factor NusA [Gammaproteobacteria bacterium]